MSQVPHATGHSLVPAQPLARPTSTPVERPSDPALDRLVDHLLEVAPVAAQTGQLDVSVPQLPDGHGAAELRSLCELGNRVAERLGASVRFRVGGAGAGSCALGALVRGLEQRLLEVRGLAGAGQADVELAVRRRAAGHVSAWRGKDVLRPDGTVLHTAASDDPDAPPVVIASACCMPMALTRSWLSALAPEHRVVTLETRGTSGELGPGAAFDSRGWGPQQQADDLLAVIAAYGLEDVHVMGLCGGAVIALLAARGGGPICSLSLWHGDFDLGGDSVKSDHQRNLQALLQMAAEDRTSAAEIRAVLSATALHGVPEHVEHLVVQPYVDDELFYRYARLTGSVMGCDLTSVLPEVAQPCLVVTSETDTTAHPQGSVAVAQRLPRGRLQVEPTGTHIDVFDASARQQQLLADFLQRGGER
jgi:3-oxoadipate enol-lactonase